MCVWKIKMILIFVDKKGGDLATKMGGDKCKRENDSLLEVLR